MTGSRVLLCLFMAGAGLTDLRRGKVYNWWLAIGALAGIYFQGQDFFRPAGAALVMTYLLFLFRLLGAGDGKLIAVLVGWLGVWDGLCAVWTGLAVGGFWALGRILGGYHVGRRFRTLYAHVFGVLRTGRAEPYGVSDIREQDGRIPLAACMAVGTTIYLIYVGRRVL
ncbi:MAG: A24 family peptidase [Clostridiales bacterium]|nr:A24 family peptidase [Clostridiales bacterium]